MNSPESVKGFDFLYKSDKKRYYGIGNLVEWTREQIKKNNIDLHKDNYRCQCPYCLEAYKWDSSYEGVPYTKAKLYVLENMQEGHCFRCDRVFIDNSEQTDVRTSAAQYKEHKTPKKVVKLDGAKWNLDLFELFSEYTEEGYQYLIRKRHKTMAKLYKTLKIRFFKENPVIPFFYKGELIYFQIKYVDKKKHGMPYFSPPISDKPAYIIEHGLNKKFVICEGVFDAIACLLLYPDRTPFAVLGSSITDYEINMLRSYVPEDIMIFMDETSISQKIKDKIKDVITYCPISIKYSNGEDPEEYYKRLRSEASDND